MIQFPHEPFGKKKNLINLIISSVKLQSSLLTVFFLNAYKG